MEKIKKVIGGIGFCCGCPMFYMLGSTFCGWFGAVETDEYNFFLVQNAKKEQFKLWF